MNTIVQGLRKTFNTGRTKSREWRIKQLNQLEKLLNENTKEISDALKKDLNKPSQESIVFEIGMVKNAIIEAINHLDEYIKPQEVKPQLAMRLTYSSYVQYQPYGVVLVLGAWNYPFQLTFVPAVGAIASGNCVLIKPSEVSEESALLIEKLILKYMDPDCIKVVNGGVKETVELLENRFDYIMYTGNTNIGKSVMKAASKYMTPVTLECGGKSPVYIDSSADLVVTAKRIAWGRFVNAGQTCIAPDYVLCTKEVQDKFIPCLKQALKEYYSENPKESENYGRIVNARHFQRIKNLIDNSKVIVGGETDEKTNYIAPTVMVNVDANDKVMKEEIFGPVLPILIVKDHNEAIEFINASEKPLALYVFAKNEKIYNDFLEQTSSGGYAYNDVLVHCALECLPFGGVGESGLGGYHGKYSFETFSHRRAVLKGTLFGDFLMGFRYPPYTPSKLSQATLATGLSRRSFLSKLFGNPLIVVAAAIIVAIIYKSR